MQKILFLLFLIACTGPEKLSQQECEILSMEAFRGSPKSAHKLKESCSDYKLTYTKEHCQKAFEFLILSGDEQQIKEKFGNQAIGCFDDRQREKFLKRK